ncbi:hypothetical protein JG687_00007413 [Phytophthora cactorum]|uniref:Uncharacterized protein n=1 Tax=Phytophthora cactorum TaxID=29920 RepID=A0A329SV22_9STRA|nr:hypothetical protein Pcac1_g26095 [Phytophthora cactorum]KAG3204557.1 hypothetical protein PC128_g1826 [Phytophthora cactorum]KAG6961956.1 hypothetical protein JG687_00007413 [Phytophthora cactorum]RAW40943.1 hypothetical protein PC110_g2890 [Phytophthora cactorum]
MAHSPPEIERRWGFLAPWCKVLIGRLVYGIALYDLDVWDCRKHSIGLKLNDDELEINRSSLEMIRETLVMLPAVAHVDHTAAKYLLDSYCEVEADILGERVEDVFPLSVVILGDVPGFQ